MTGSGGDRSGGSYASSAQRTSFAKHTSLGQRCDMLPVLGQERRTGPAVHVNADGAFQDDVDTGGWRDGLALRENHGMLWDVLVGEGGHELGTCVLGECLTQAVAACKRQQDRLVFSCAELWPDFNRNSEGTSSLRWR